MEHSIDFEIEQRKRIGGSIRENEGEIRSLTNLQDEILNEPYNEIDNSLIKSETMTDKDKVPINLSVMNMPEQ